MADSENSRTLPAITRRKIPCAPAALAVGAGISFAASASASPAPIEDADPFYLQLSDLRWDAEVQLCKSRFLEVEIRLPDARTSMRVEAENQAAV
uniref:hypothetical protein n=1 Tax=Neorhizobium sp. EC2-8 TaxID=3129230 RepID=UPI0031019AFC